LIEEETAGDPMSDAKWTRTTLSKISELLKEQGSLNTLNR